MRIGLKGLAAGALTLAAFAMGGASAAQAQTTGPVLESGKTKAVYNYKNAVRERVYIPQFGIDQDHNGQMDFITADVIRPSEASATNKIPAIIDPSPYYTTVCRGNETQCMADWDNDGVNDRWPLFLDNYFVPRGYAYILGQMNGTGYTEEGCPMHGGPGDIAGEKSIVDWLNGRVKAYALKAGTNTTPDLTKEVVADWHNGSSAMIGKSYDGTLSNGVAATGVEGLKTIVPISAISDWYLYSRTGGIRNNTNYPGGSLNNTITTGPSPPTGVFLPNRRAVSLTNQGPCGDENNAISDDVNEDTGDGDKHGDYNTFWNERNYTLNASKVKAAVFATHGFQDDNVRMDHEYKWMQALKANGVKTKLWLLRAGHTDPFDSNRAEWVNTLHRRFDHYLYGVDNGVDSEPAVKIEDEANVWHDYASWPIPGTKDVDVFLRGGSDAAAPGTLGGATGGAVDTQSFTGTSNYPNETTVINTPTGSQASRRVFLSKPLTQDVRLSGQPMVDLVASVAGTQQNFGAVLVDYGVGQQVTRQNEGIQNKVPTSTDSGRTCWGDTSTGGPDCTLGAKCDASAKEIDTACYLEVTKPIIDVPNNAWRVSRGTLDSSNRESLWYQNASPISPNTMYHYKFPTMATEHTFKAGHQIGIVIVGNLYGGTAGGGTFPSPTSASPAQAITIDTKQSKVSLPIAGGYGALATAGGTDAETVAPTLGDVPADIATATTDKTGTTVSYTLPTATDNEDPNPVVTCDPASGSKFAVGTTTVTCVAKDANGNTSAPKTFKVVVRQDVPVDGTVGGAVPATLALTLGTPGTFGAFTPGITKTYTAETPATVTSTAGDALLSVSDPSSVGTGHLVNGTFVLPQPLQLRARNAANTGTAYNNVGSSLNLLTWNGPVANDDVKLQYSQLVNSGDPLRTGTYSKTLTFTLSTTTP
jgi:X-Pro dipeptidyl-peptidase